MHLEAEIERRRAAHRQRHGAAPSVLYLPRRAAAGLNALVERHYPDLAPARPDEPPDALDGKTLMGMYVVLTDEDEVRVE